MMTVVATVVTRLLLQLLLLLVLLVLRDLIQAGNDDFSVPFALGLKGLNPLGVIAKNGSYGNLNFGDFMPNWGIRVITFVPILQNTSFQGVRRDRRRVTLRERGDNGNWTQGRIDLFALFDFDGFLGRAKLILIRAHNNTTDITTTTTITTQNRGHRNNGLINRDRRLGNNLVRDRRVNERGCNGANSRRNNLLRGQHRDRLGDSAGNDREVNVMLAGLVACHNALQLRGCCWRRGGRYRECGDGGRRRRGHDHVERRLHFVEHNEFAQVFRDFLQLVAVQVDFGIGAVEDERLLRGRHSELLSSHLPQLLGKVCPGERRLELADRAVQTLYLAVRPPLDPEPPADLLEHRGADP